MEPKYYDKPNRQWGTSYQTMPKKWFDALPDTDYIMSEAPGKWHAEKKSSVDSNTIYRHYGWCDKDKKAFPKVFKEMMEYHKCINISMFIGLHEGANSSLGWHVDNYEVWAFNILGATKWTWFEISGAEGHRGEIREQIVEPGHIFFMPKGVSHKVDVLSDERTSISIIA